MTLKKDGLNDIVNLIPFVALPIRRTVYTRVARFINVKEVHGRLFLGA